MEIAKARREEQAKIEDARTRVAENVKVNVLLKKLKQEEFERELMEEEKHMPSRWRKKQSSSSGNDAKQRTRGSKMKRSNAF